MAGGRETKYISGCFFENELLISMLVKSTTYWTHGQSHLHVVHGPPPPGPPTPHPEDRHGGQGLLPRRRGLKKDVHWHAWTATGCEWAPPDSTPGQPKYSIQDQRLAIHKQQNISSHRMAPPFFLRTEVHGDCCGMAPASSRREGGRGRADQLCLTVLPKEGWPLGTVPAIQRSPVPDSLSYPSPPPREVLPPSWPVTSPAPPAAC